MGLDMYLTAERYFRRWPDDGPDMVIANDVIALLPELVAAKATVQTVSAEVGYWRKANAIHNWFVQNVQDGKDECKDHEVSYEQLVDLRDVCNKVMEDNTLAPTLLPTGSGFFFGNTEYDHWYFTYVAATVTICNNVLDNLLPTGDVYSHWDIKYCSSW
jgi:hypothetical protein